MTHTLIMIVAAERSVLKPRSWWQFWGRDQLVTAPDWQSRRLEGLSDKQREYLEQATDSVELAELLRTLVTRPGEALLNIYFEGDEPKVQEKPTAQAPTMQVWAPKVPT